MHKRSPSKIVFSIHINVALGHTRFNKLPVAAAAFDPDRRQYRKGVGQELFVSSYDYESLSTSTSNSFKFKVEGNDFSSANDKDLKIAVPAGFLGIFAPDGTTDFDVYLDSVNTGAETEITGSPEVFRF